MFRVILSESQNTSLVMDKHLVMIVLSLLCKTATCSYGQRKLHEFNNPIAGRYCPTEGSIVANLAWPQCKLFCLQQSPNCQAVNYNFTGNICTYFLATCSKAVGHPNMPFTLFTGRRPEQCMEWIPKTRMQTVRDERAVTEDNMRFVTCGPFY